MYLWVDQEKCDGCGGCSLWLAGMPEGGFAGQEVPKWFIRDLPEYLYMIEGVCMSRAITLVQYVEVIRLENSMYGMLGVLRINGQVFGSTLEPAHRINPSGTGDTAEHNYWIRPYESSQSGPVWRATNGTETSCIEFQPGNTTEHKPGSVLIGESETKLRGHRDHTRSVNSGKTYLKFMNALKGVSYHRLSIREFF